VQEFARNPQFIQKPAHHCVLRLESKMSVPSDEPIAAANAAPEESASKGSVENRSQMRYSFTASAEVYELRTQTRVVGRCSDLGMGGCYIDTLAPFSVGSVVRIRVENDTREFASMAIVAYAHASMGMGLRFTDMKPAHRQVLRYWIAGLSGEALPEPAAAATDAQNESQEMESNMRLVLSELISLLVSKKILTQSEGAEMLLQVFR